jgi:hypothetical protein
MKMVGFRRSPRWTAGHRFYYGSCGYNHGRSFEQGHGGVDEYDQRVVPLRTEDWITPTSFCESHVRSDARIRYGISRGAYY